MAQILIDYVFLCILDNFYCRLLIDAVLNFQNTQEEVTLIVNPEKIVLKNYVDDEPGIYCLYHEGRLVWGGGGGRCSAT